jgi:hypothetical protein
LKPCKYCGESIQDTARKCPHCQSFQETSDAPKQPFELATLVISFVGVIATVGTIAAGILGIVGFRTIGDLGERTKELSQKSTEILQKAQQQIKDFDGELLKSKSTVAALETKAAELHERLNGVSISQRYDQFQQILDLIQLDYAYNFPQQIDDLIKISADSEKQQPIPALAKTNVLEMKALSQAVVEYRDSLKDNDKDGFLSIITIVNSVHDESLGKYRFLIGAYSHLYDIEIEAGHIKEAANYRDKQKHYAAVAYRIAGRLNRTATIAKINYAVTLIQGGDPKEMDRGYEYLLEAKKDAPQIAGISYNIAMYFAKRNRLDDALNNLEDAKRLGDFATCNDLFQWEADKSFDSLRITTVP